LSKVEETGFIECLIDGSIIAQVDWSNFSICETDFSKTELGPANFERGVMLRCSFAGQSLSAVRIKNCSLNESTFIDVQAERCEMVESLFLGSEFENCVFASAGLSASNFSKSKISNCSFEASRLTSANFDSIEGTNLNFSRSDLSSALLRSACLFETTFVATELRLSDFSRCKIRNVDFTDAVFENCKWEFFDEAVELSDSQLKGIIDQ
jgi:uncharacterized protein YjbI with pentapeptide repeats